MGTDRLVKRDHDCTCYWLEEPSKKRTSRRLLHSFTDEELADYERVDKEYEGWQERLYGLWEADHPEDP